MVLQQTLVQLRWDNAVPNVGFGGVVWEYLVAVYEWWDACEHNSSYVMGFY